GPVAGARLSEEELRTLSVDLMPEPWRVPRSFDEVPEAVRERALENGPPDLPMEPPERVGASIAVAPRTRPLRVAMVGSGRQARRLARDARGVPGASIDAVASPHALQADLRDFGDCPAYADAAAALDDIRPEAVIIAAATAAHDELVRLAISRGIPALVEKPLTSTEEQAEALRAAVSA